MVVFGLRNSGDPPFTQNACQNKGIGRGGRGELLTRAVLVVLALVVAAPAAALEDRLWEGIGPDVITSGGVSGIEDGEVVGAVNTVALHPTDPDEMFLGATNGGVWRTRNATDDQPEWIDVSEDLPSLSIGDITYDIADASNQTLYVGFGRYSSYARTGGSPQWGLYQSTNGGDDWTDIDGTALDNRSINAIVANGNTLLVSVLNRTGTGAQGLFLGQSSGGTWIFTQVSGRTPPGAPSPILPAGRTFEVVADPTTANRYYVMNGAGVYRITLPSTNPQNAAWTKVSDATVDGALSVATHGRLAIGPGGEVFAAVSQAGTVLSNLFRSADGSTGWQSLDTPISNRFDTWFLSLAADPNDGNTVYVGGGGGGSQFRIDASQPSGSQATRLFGSGTAGGSRPHADSRDLAFDANDDLIEANDGGVYKQTSPEDGSGDWVSLNGNLAITEIHNLSWDDLSHIAIAGVQDNGTNIQSDLVRNRWLNINGNDGGDVGVDAAGSTTQSERYLSSQNFAGLQRVTFDLDNTETARASPTLAEPGCPAGFAGTCSTINPAFTTPLAINTVAPNRLVVAANNAIYESQDQGQNVVQISTRNGNANFTGADALAVGADGNADALYVGSGDDVLVRTSGGFGNSPTASDPDPMSGANIVDVAVDPNDDQSAFALDAGDVFWTDDAGSTWTNITGDLGTVSGGTAFRSLAYSTANTDGAVLVGTDNGVFMARGDASTVTDAGGDPIPFTDWEPLGVGLPQAPVYDLDYSVTDEILVAGTFGRGAWAINLEERDPIDVALVMDKSGSMGGDACLDCSSKITVLKDAAELFIRTWQTLSDADDRIAAVFFDSTVETFSDSDGDELVTLAGNGDDVIDYVRSKTDGGQTALGGGVQTGISILTDEERPRSLIVFTDGMQNRDPSIELQDGTYEIRNTGAPGSGVSPTTPPTQLDSDLDIAVNTIGVGVTDSFDEELNDISSGANGLHKQTNNADADLRRFFIEQLVDALRDASPQLVDYRYSSLDGGRDRQDFRINVGAKKVVFAVSWDRRDATSASVTVLKDGADVTSQAEEHRADDFYRVLAFDTSETTPISSDGTWRIVTSGSSGIDYEIATLADDSLLGYEFDITPSLLAGDAGTTLLSAYVTVNGLTYAEDTNVTARIAVPRESQATVLATTPTPPEVVDFREPGETMVEAKLRYLLLNDPEFRRRLEPRYVTVPLTRTGAGRFTASFSETDVAGAYRVTFRLEGDGPRTGAFERREQHFLMVVPGPFGEGDSTIETSRTDVGGGRTRTVVRVRPQDENGNYLGSGRAEDVMGTVVSTGATGTVHDDGDGWYVITFESTDPDPEVSVVVGGDTVAMGTADDIETEGRPGPGPGVGALPRYYVSGLVGFNGYRDDDVTFPPFVDGTGATGTFESDLGFVAGVALGADLARVRGVNFRAEAELAWREAEIDDAAGLFPAGGERETLTLMTNGAADFTTLGGIRPYLGAGIGIAFNDASQPLFDNGVMPPAEVLLEEDDGTDFAWQVFAGASRDLARDLEIFVQGRYLDAGSLDVHDAGGSTTTLDLETLSVEIGLRLRF